MNNTLFWPTQRSYGRYDAPYPGFDSDSIEPFFRRSIPFQAAPDTIRGSRHPRQMLEPPFDFSGFPEYQRAPAPVEMILFNTFPTRPVNPRFSGPLLRVPTRQEDAREEQKKVLSKLRKEVYNPTPKQMTKRLNSYYRDKKRGIEKGTEVDEDGKRCAVCLEDFEARENVMLTPCEHMFHEECIVPWVKDRGDCPVCRFVLSERIKRSPASASASIIRAMEEALIWNNSF